MIKTLIIADGFDENTLKESVLALLTFANDINSPQIDLAVTGLCKQNNNNIDEILKLFSKVFKFDAECTCPPSPRCMANAISEIAGDYTHIIAPTSYFGKELISYLAGILEISPISNVVKIKDQSTLKRVCYAGSVLETVRVKTRTCLVTVVTSGFQPHKDPAETNDYKLINITTHQESCDPHLIMQHDRRHNIMDKNADLTTADIVIAAGRGIGSAENFNIVREMAKKMGGAVGATKVAVDREFAPNDCQIGQTGKTISPDVYFSFCMSGSQQHIAGIKNSKIIVAVNSDENAPIFKYCDFYMVTDFFDVYEEITEKCSFL